MKLDKIKVNLKRLLGVLVAATLLSGCSNNHNKESEAQLACEAYKETFTIPIYSLNLNSNVEGNYSGGFLSGYGTLNETEYYIFYILQDDGGLKLTKINMNDAILYLDIEDDKQPYYEYTRECGWVDILNQPVEIIKDYKIHLPKNAVQKEYDGNLSNIE